MRNPRQALDESKVLVEQGRYREAIELLSEVNRARPTPALEMRLVDLRHEAFAGLESTGLDHWPPRDVGRREPDGTLLEVHRDELTVDALRSGIIGGGALLVRGLLDRDRAGELADGIDRAFAAGQLWDDGRVTPESKAWFRPFKATGSSSFEGGRHFVRQGGGLWTADSPRMMFKIIDMLHSVGFVDLVDAYLGEPAAISVKKSTLRIVPPDSGTNWHQDGAFLGRGIRTCNLWLALSSCGEEAPSLDVVPQRLDEIVETGTNGAVFDWSVGPGTVEQVAGDAGVLRPRFEPGDALLFDDMFLHRTGVGEGMTKPRYAIESWFFAASTYPLGQVPILV